MTYITEIRAISLELIAWVLLLISNAILRVFLKAISPVKYRGYHERQMEKKVNALSHEDGRLVKDMEYRAPG